ncbi:MAG TPA: class I SAM-dependent methyltransferase [Anaerolineaceae bacterium]|nr:class I SAM-dependent methyltransferase [Anaerolineaceae bacterium]HPN51445.1 class I SAM-dependent methyltransferase [Anaerolineaceae bacterium]
MLNKDWPERSCPICHHSQKTLLHRQNFSEISEGSLLDGYDVVVCQQCGYGFADRIPEQAIFDAYYQGMSKYENQENLGQPNSYDWKRFNLVVDQLKPFLISTRTQILEIGCATGGLLSLLKANGQTSVMGLDPSLACARTALKDYQIKVEVGSLFNHPLNQSFEFLILIGVMEHIENLQKGVIALADLLGENGRVYIEVPDALHFADWPDAPYQQFSTEHINFFSPVSLQNLMHQNGFKTLQCFQAVREHNYRSMMPVVCGLFEKQSSYKAPLDFDKETQSALQAYIQASKEVDAHLQEVIEEIVQSQTPIYVWGVGTHTQRLLVESALGKAHITAFIDSNPNYHGKTLQNIPILPPQAVENQPQTPILISSKVFQKEIEDTIRQQYKYSNPLICLYRV